MRIAATLAAMGCLLAAAPPTSAITPTVGTPSPAPATDPPSASIITSNSGTGPFNGININRFVGADKFYLEGYGGARAVIANIEAGHTWDGHETLPHITTFINDPSIGGTTRQYDWHATMVGHVLNGRGWGYGLIINEFDLATWFGIAADATLWSGAVATSWNPQPGSDFTGSFNLSTQTLVYAYQTAMETSIAGRKADVVNTSWGFTDPTGSSQETLILDALAYANRTTLVLAAGNHEAGTAQVVAPGSGYNSIAVGALVSDTSVPPYGTVAAFSNTGPNDFFNPKTGTVTPAARSAVDITAPGDNLTLAFYGGLTGGHTSGSDPVGGSGNFYILDMGGTSFASPVVAGGAALVVDAGYDRFGGGDATDGRVVKAVLLNSADKLDGWSNDQTLVDGVVTTSQGLDLAAGAGAMNLTRAFEQYTAGTTDVPGTSGGEVDSIGWDYGEVAAGDPNDYFITAELLAGSTLSVTLDWWVNRQFEDQTLTAADVQFSDLDLQVWRAESSVPTDLIAESISAYNNVEHLYFDLPGDGFYMLRVLWYGENYDVPGDTPDADAYALAWSVTPVPEPATLALLLGAGVLAALRRRRQ